LVLTNTGSLAQSPSCFCTSRILCQWKPYGSHPLDIAVLGLHPPCREYNHVVCCNKSEFKWYYGNDEILSRPRIDSKPGNDAQSDIKPTGRNLVRSTTEKTTVRSTTEEIAFRSTTVKVIKDVLKSDSKSKDKSVSDFDNDEDDTKCGCLPFHICPTEFRKHSGTCDPPLFQCCVPHFHDSEKDITVKEGSDEEVVEETEPNENLMTIVKVGQLERESNGDTEKVIKEDKFRPLKGEIDDHEQRQKVLFELKPRRISNSELKGVIAGASLVTGKIPQKTVSMVKGRRVRLLQPPAPKVTIVPCVTICPGETYSASNEQHLNDFGLLAPCDSDSQMIRCIYSLNLDIFMHPENLNLPIFNADKFAETMVNQKMQQHGNTVIKEKPHDKFFQPVFKNLFQIPDTKAPQSTTNKIEPSLNNQEDLRSKVNQRTLSDEDTKQQKTDGNQEKGQDVKNNFQGARRVVTLFNKLKLLNPPTVSKKPIIIADKTVITTTEKIESNTVTSTPTPSPSPPDVPSKTSHRNIFANIFRNQVEASEGREKSVGTESTNEVDDRMNKHIFSNFGDSKDDVEGGEVTERTTEMVSKEVERLKRPVVPYRRAREIYKLGIDMEDDKSANVMFVMKSERKQFKVGKEDLLPVLELLMNTLIDLENEEKEQKF